MKRTTLIALLVTVALLVPAAVVLAQGNTPSAQSATCPYHQEMNWEKMPCQGEMGTMMGQGRMDAMMGQGQMGSMDRDQMGAMMGQGHMNSQDCPMRNDPSG